MSSRWRTGGALGRIQDGARGELLGELKMAHGGSSVVGVGWLSPFSLRCVDQVFLKVDILPF